MKIALFSDVHANLPALEAFFSDIEREQPDAIYCLGDLVGYNIWANEVTEEIRRRKITTIMGNHDEALLLPLKPNDNSNRGITRQLMTLENRNYLINLPRHLKLTFGKDRNQIDLLMVHGSPKSINDYLVEEYPEEEILKMMVSENAQIMLCGHTHIPYHRILKVDKEYSHLINIGSVGKPKDNDPRLCYAILYIDENLVCSNPHSLKVEFKRVDYDLKKAVDAIEKSDFPDEYADLLINAR